LDKSETELSGLLKAARFRMLILLVYTMQVRAAAFRDASAREEENQRLKAIVAGDGNRQLSDERQPVRSAPAS
jgi:hypothetical protein